MVNILKLKKYIIISGRVRCKAGTHIGGSKEDLEIGGMDNPIIRDPVDKLPYFPGSSLKGNLRSRLEYKYGRVGWKYNVRDQKAYYDERSGEPCGCQQDISICPVCTIFGPHKAIGHKLGPTRIIVRDAYMTEESQIELAKLMEQGLHYSEMKNENTVNRRTGVAQHPRQLERVPRGTQFDLSITLRIFEDDDEKKMVEYIQEALDMLQQEYLGGSGTRGSGWVEIKDLKIE